MARYSTLDPIAALATPWGESALAVIRTSGKESLLILEKIFRGRSPLSSAKGNTLRHGFIIDPKTDTRIDEVLLTIYRAPRSYTGEDSAEILCHGSPVIVRMILTLLESSGFREAGPGEFTMRAFLNKKLDLTRAEAVNDIVHARTEKARAAAFNRLSGVVENRIVGLKDKLLAVLARIEVLLDYSEDEVDGVGADYPEAAEAEEMASALLATFAGGKIIQEGITVVIAGSTNAGKSTLFNLLLREDRAIVSDIHGTTRDFIEGTVSIEGIPVRLFDTAGIRTTDHPIEIEGMKRTDKIVRNANIVLFVADAERGLTPEDEEFLASQAESGKVIRVWNKVDLSANSCPDGFVPVSAKQGSGIEAICAVIAEQALGDATIGAGDAVIDSYRQKELLERVLSAIRDFRKGLASGMPLDVIAICLNDGLNALGEITGEITSQDVLEAIFSRFCVGK
jgi:tRNA modification GTPase